MLDGTSVAELEVEYGDLKIHLQRDVAIARPLISPHPVDLESERATLNGHDEAESVVTAGYVGEFRRSDDGPRVGDEVAEGTRLAEIEVLGILNAVLAPVEGVLTAVLVENEAPVEYGQPLAVIRPNPSLFIGAKRLG